MSNMEIGDNLKHLARRDRSASIQMDELYIEDGYYEADGDSYHDRGEGGGGRSLPRWVVSTLRKHWLMIFITNLLLTGATIAYVAQAPDYYTARSRIQVNNEINQAISSNAVVVTNPGSDPGYFSTQLEILNGSSLMRRVIRERDLENNKDFLNPGHLRQLSVWQNIGKMFGFYTPPLPRSDKERIPGASEQKNSTLSLKKEVITNPDVEAERLAPYVDRILGGLTIDPVEQTRLIQIEYTHGDPVLASKIANAVGDVYVLQNLESKVTSNTSAGEFLQKRVAELQSEIRQGEERLVNYARNNKIIPLDSAQNTVVDRFGDLNRQLGVAETDRIAATAALQAALKNTTSSNSDGQIIALENQVLTLKQRLTQLKTQYTDDWYEVIEVRKQIQAVENQIASLTKRATDSQIGRLRETLTLATSKEEGLKQSFDDQRKNVISQNAASINYKIIQQEIASNTALLDGLLQRSKENEAVVAGIKNNVHVQDRAIIPGSPSGPDRTKNVLLAFLVSLGLGIGLALSLEWFNDSVNSNENLEGLLGLPVLALIPAAPLSFTQTIQGKIFSLTSGRSKRTRRQYNLGWFTTPQFKETYAQLATNLILSGNGDKPRTFLITSASEGEGKTLNALSLATSLAATTGSALLVDGDLRCPRIHTLTGLENNDGLTHLLSTKELLTDKKIEGAVQKDPNSNLEVLTAGKSTSNPVGLLSSEQMVELLNALSLKYKHVVIDSPPLVFFADGLVLARLVDSTVIVVRDQVSSKSTVLKVKKILKHIGANVSGMVINGVERSFKSYYKYYDSENGDIFIENVLEDDAPQSLNLNE